VQVHCSSILTVRQKPFAVQSNHERPFDTQAIEIVNSWDLLRDAEMLKQDSRRSTACSALPGICSL
jgi:hypothetical protein